MFLLDASALGSVSDWCMVVITTITAYYLYKTLQSQKDVQATQTKLYEIESLRFRESIKPKFKFVRSDLKHNISDEDKEIVTIEVINETDSHALEISCECPDNMDAKRVVYTRTLTHLVKGDTPLQFHFLVDKEPKIGTSYIIFILSYKDISGVKYTQRVWCIKDRDYLEINPYLPEVMN